MMKNMMNKIASIKKVYKLWVLAFIQIWVWPQIMLTELPTGFSISLGITIIICSMYNLICLINAYEDGEY